MQEILAGAAGFEVDRLVETKGLDAIDRWHRVSCTASHLCTWLKQDFACRAKAKRHAEEQAEHMYAAQYGPPQGYQPPQQPFNYGTLPKLPTLHLPPALPSDAVHRRLPAGPRRLWWAYGRHA